MFSFDAKQNYHMLPVHAMQEAWYDTEIFAIDSSVSLAEDPNFVQGTSVVYYTSFLQYISYLRKNRHCLVYSNSLTFKTLLVWLFVHKSIFMAHDQAIPLAEKKLKKWIVLFFYRFFTCIRVINSDEQKQLSRYHIPSVVVPLSISNAFYSTNTSKKNFLFIGNLYYDKNPEFLITTMQEVIQTFPDAVLHIYGEDRYNKNGKNYKQLIDEAWLEKNILVHGFVPHKELKERLSEALIYINTSISEWQCLAVYEAALAWCILCLQNIISFPSVFTTNALYHTTPEDLAANITKILHNPDMYRTAVIANQHMILHEYSYEHLKEKTKIFFLSYA